MILTYNSALKKGTNVKNPVGNHTRDESSGSNSCSGLNSHWCLWSEQLPLRAPRVSSDRGSLQDWSATTVVGSTHQDDWQMLEAQPTLTSIVRHTSIYYFCSANCNYTIFNTKISSGFPTSDTITKKG